MLLDPAYGWGLITISRTWALDRRANRLARQSIHSVGRHRQSRRLAVDAVRHIDLLLAGLSGVPPDPKEAAIMDGAGPVQLFWHITLPFLRPFIAIALVLRSIDAFKTFGSIFVLTTGGPGTSETEVINLYPLSHRAAKFPDIGAAGLRFRHRVPGFPIGHHAAIAWRDWAQHRYLGRLRMKSLSIVLVRRSCCGRRAFAATMFPLFWVLLTSFKPPEISQALPPVWNFTPTLQNYRDVMTGNTYTSRCSGC